MSKPIEWTEPSTLRWVKGPRTVRLAVRTTSGPHWIHKRDASLEDVNRALASLGLRAIAKDDSSDLEVANQALAWYKQERVPELCKILELRTGERDAAIAAKEAAEKDRDFYRGVCAGEYDDPPLHPKETLLRNVALEEYEKEVRAFESERDKLRPVIEAARAWQTYGTVEATQRLEDSLRALDAGEAPKPAGVSYTREEDGTHIDGLVFKYYEPAQPKRASSDEQSASEPESACDCFENVTEAHAREASLHDDVNELRSALARAEESLKEAMDECATSWKEIEAIRQQLRESQSIELAARDVAHEYAAHGLKNTRWLRERMEALLGAVRSTLPEADSSGGGEKTSVGEVPIAAQRSQDAEPTAPQGGKVTGALCRKCGRNREMHLPGKLNANVLYCNPNDVLTFDPAPPKSDPKPWDESMRRNCEAPDQGYRIVPAPDCGGEDLCMHCGFGVGSIGHTNGDHKFEPCSRPTAEPKAEAIDEWSDSYCDERIAQGDGGAFGRSTLTAIKRRNARIAMLEADEQFNLGRIRELEAELAEARKREAPEKAWRRALMKADEWNLKEGGVPSWPYEAPQRAESTTRQGE